MTLTKTERNLGIFYAVFQKLCLPTILGFVCGLLGIRSNYVANFLFYSVNFLAWGYLFRRILIHSFQNLENLLPAVAVGIPAYYLASIAMSYLVLAIDPEFSNVNDATIGALLSAFPPLAFAIIVLVPVAEECCFRGLLFVPFMHTRPWLGYALSAALFAAVHVTPYIGAVELKTLLLCYIQYIPAALVLCRACKKADSLAAPIVIHAFINAMGVVLSR